MSLTARQTRTDRSNDFGVIAFAVMLLLAAQAFIEGRVEAFLAYCTRIREHAELTLDYVEYRYGVADQMDTTIQVVGLVIVAIVGIGIVASFTSSFDAPTNTGLSESRQNILVDFGSGIELIGPLILILFAVLILLAVMRLRQAQ